MEAGKITLDWLDMITRMDDTEAAAKVEKVASKMGFSAEVVFQLDQLFTGGFHASIQLNVDIIGLSAVAPEIADGIDLVNLFGIPSVDCTSEALKGNKCFTVGVKDDSRKCEEIEGLGDGAHGTQQASAIALAVIMTTYSAIILA